MIINPVEVVACSKCGVVYNSRKKECPVCKNGAFDSIDFKNKQQLYDFISCISGSCCLLNTTPISEGLLKGHAKEYDRNYVEALV